MPARPSLVPSGHRPLAAAAPLVAPLVAPLAAPLVAALAVILAPAFLGAAPAAAHAVVVTSDPTAGAALAAPPRHVILHFNSRIDQGRSRLLLVGPGGLTLTLDPAADSQPTVLEADLRPGDVLPAGPWRMRWQVLAVDGHITRGDVPFTLKAP